MILAKVYYHLFPHELDSSGVYICIEDHMLNRELELEMESGETYFMSWVSEPVQFSVGMSRESYFPLGEFIVYDASDHPFWRELIGKDVSISEAAENSQALSVSSSNSSVFILSRDGESWESDTLTISRNLPAYVPSNWEYIKLPRTEA